MAKKICFMFVNKDFTLDGMRSVLGLSVEDEYSYGVVMNNELPELSDYHKENLDFIRDMEGEIFSTVPANVEKHGMVAMTLEELGQKLRDMDVIVPYGIIRANNQ